MGFATRRGRCPDSSTVPSSALSRDERSSQKPHASAISDDSGPKFHLLLVFMLRCSFLFFVFFYLTLDFSSSMGREAGDTLDKSLTTHRRSASYAYSSFSVVV